MQPSWIGLIAIGIIAGWLTGKIARGDGYGVLGICSWASSEPSYRRLDFHPARNFRTRPPRGIGSSHAGRARLK